MVYGFFCLNFIFYFQEECNEQKVINELETVFMERRERQLNGCENKPIDASPAPSSRLSMRWELGILVLIMLYCQF